jgi:hypothetical protein
MGDGRGISRRDFLGVSAGAALAARATALAGAAVAPADGAALDVGDRRQLFIDRRFVADETNVTLTMNPPQKLGIVLDSGNAPWEHGPGGFFRVIEDAGKLKLYYGAFTRAGQSLCYAESDDGLAWTKPRLGLVEVEGSRDNNIILADDAIDATIMLDPRDVPERRYKLFRSLVTSDCERAGVYAAYSADGLHFTDVGRVLPMWPETGLIADFDPRVGRYVVYTRVFARSGENQRRIARIETDDLLAPWPFEGEVPDAPVPSPENLPVVLAADGDDDPHADIYTNATCIYPYAQDVYLMFPTPFRHFAPARQPWFAFEPGNEYGLIEVQLAVSRDGIHWDRPDRRPYIAMGLPDEWDRWLDMMGTGMARRGSYLYQYYWSTGRTHDSGILRPEYADSLACRNAIGAVRQRLDGFVSADFAYTGGTLTTPPLAFSGTHLRLNIDTGAMGTAFVELRDADGQALPGYALGECEEVGGNFVDAPVRWAGRADVSGLRGKAVRLHIAARRAKLYAFEFASGTPPA